MGSYRIVTSLTVTDRQHCNRCGLASVQAFYPVDDTLDDEDEIVTVEADNAADAMLRAIAVRCQREASRMVRAREGNS